MAALLKKLKALRGTTVGIFLEAAVYAVMLALVLIACIILTKKKML